MEHLSHITLMYSQFILINIILVIIGRRITSCFPMEIEKQYGEYLNPILGLAFLVLISTLYGWLFAFNFAASACLIFCLLGFCLYHENSYRECLSQIFLVIIFSCICALPIMYFIIRYDGFNPATDIFTYLAQSQWLQNHPFKEKAIPSGFFPYLTQISLYQSTGSRMGSTFILGFFQSLFHVKWSYNIYITTVSIALSSGCLAFAVFIRQVVSLNRLIILLLCLFPAYSLNGYVFGAQWGFFPQTFGLSFLVGVMAILPVLIEYNLKNNVSFKKNTIYIFPLSLASAAFLFAYNEPFLIFALALAIYFFFLIIYEKEKRLLLCNLIFIFFLETVLLTNYEFFRVVKNLSQTLGIVNHLGGIGWPVLWKPWQFAAFSFGLYDDLLRYFEMVSLIIFSIMMLFILIGSFNLIKNNKNSKYLLSLLYSLEFVFFICFVKFRYFTASPTPNEIGFTFMQFKIAKYASPFSIALLLVVLADYVQNHIKYKKHFFVLYSLLAIISVTYLLPKNMSRLYSGFANQMGVEKNIFASYMKLRDYVKAHPSLEPLYIDLGPSGHKLRQIISYVLYDTKIASNYSDDGYIVGQLPLEDVVMRPENTNSTIVLDDVFLTTLSNKMIITPFIIMKKPYSYTKLVSSIGGYNLERSDQDTWNWVEDSISFRYQSFGKFKPNKVVFELCSSPRNFIITIKDLHKNQILSKKLYHFEHGIINLSFNLIDQNEFIINISADGESGMLSQSDSRKAKFRIVNVRVNY